ncbi:serine hydrolase [Evansella sp. AB-P1]|uniref:serine hydrolase n=1 Tax=Evansella sp. AB-P1 TaxID=3037653 RepID=UPI00241EB086|nr:serine hydrolase [Evansella sp. AB-P1]MDG5789538.1 serine hydrolase [Evansella sp. AB-P1]
MKERNWMGKFDTYCTYIQQKYSVPGIAIGLSDNGNIVLEKGYGYRDIKDKKEVTSKTIFGIASITKSFTCAGIMLLQEANKLSVQDKVRKYLPEFQLPDKNELSDEVTIHHLMTHTTGIPPLSSLSYAMKRSMDVDASADDYPGLALSGKTGAPIDTYKQLMIHIKNSDVKLLGRPGEQFSYSNDCYALLGAIIAQVSGQTYEAFITDNILKPAGMNNSTFDLHQVKQASNVTEQYSMSVSNSGDDKAYAAPVWWDAPAMRGAGFLRSTMEDMLKYGEIYRTGGMVGSTRILSTESVIQMIQPYVKFEPNRFYGYGLMITPDYHGGTLVEHGGSLKAISSQLSVIPEKGIVGITLSNLVGVPAFDLMNGVINGVLGLPIETPFKTFNVEDNVDEEELEQYIGTYCSEEGANLTIDMDETGLNLTQQEKSFPLKHIKESLFTIKMKESEAPVRFLFAEEGEVRGISMGLRQIPKVTS